MSWPAELVVALTSAGPAGPPVEVLLLVVGLVGLPAGPAEPTALTAGLLALAPEIPLWGAIFAAAAGMAGGDLMVLGVARRLRLRSSAEAGGPAEHGARASHRRRVDRAMRLLSRQGARPAPAMLVLAGGRFVPGLRTPTAAAAGLAGLPPGRCVLAVAVGSLAWACIWVCAGRLGASALDAAGGAADGLLGDGTLLGAAAVPALVVVALVLARLHRDADRLRPCSVPTARRPAPWRAEPSMHS